MIRRSGPGTDGESRAVRNARLLSAYDQLATVLESVDLEREPELANELIEALEATDRAYAVEAQDEAGTPPTDGVGVEPETGPASWQGGDALVAATVGRDERGDP